MKAKDYAAQYKNNPTPETLRGVASAMFGEIFAIAEQRKVRTDDAVLAVIEEIENKWRAFVRLCNDEKIRADGFEQIIKVKMPEIYLFWMERKKRTRFSVAVK